MRQYQTPFLMDEEPRLVGGKMTLRQGAYVLCGAACSFVLLNKFFGRSPVLAVVLIAVSLALACFLAFHKVGASDLHVDRYLLRLWLFRSRIRAYTYGRPGKGAMGC